MIKQKSLGSNFVLGGVRCILLPWSMGWVRVCMEHRELGVISYRLVKMFPLTLTWSSKRCERLICAQRTRQCPDIPTEKPPLCHGCVSFVFKMGAWLTFSMIICDSFPQTRTLVLILHASGIVFLKCLFIFFFLVCVIWIYPFLQLLVSIKPSAEGFNCCYLSMLPSMKEQCLRALVVLWVWWVLCLSKQTSQ